MHRTQTRRVCGLTHSLLRVSVHLCSLPFPLNPPIGVQVLINHFLLFLPGYMCTFLTALVVLESFCLFLADFHYNYSTCRCIFDMSVEGGELDVLLFCHLDVLCSPLVAQSWVLTLWTIACQAPLPMGFFRQEYWSGLPFPSPGDLPDPRTEPRSPPLQEDSLLSELWGKPNSLLPSWFNLQLFLIHYIPSLLASWLFLLHASYTLISGHLPLPFPYLPALFLQILLRGLILHPLYSFIWTPSFVRASLTSYLTKATHPLTQKSSLAQAFLGLLVLINIV